MNKKYRKIEKKIRVSEAVKQTCSAHISEWEGERIDIVTMFISYLAKIEMVNEISIIDEIAEITADKQHIEIIGNAIRELAKIDFLSINKKKEYEFIADSEKKTEIISISMNIQQQKEIDQAARKYNKETSQFIRQPFYFYEKHKKFPWE